MIAADPVEISLLETSEVSGSFPISFLNSWKACDVKELESRRGWAIVSCLFRWEIKKA